MARREQLDQNQSLVDLSQAIDWLHLQPFAAGRIGTIGFCMGGTLVLDLAAERDDLATVCFYGFPAGGPANMSGSPPAPLTLAEHMNGPILGFWGDQDAGVGMDNVERLDALLKARGVDHEFTIHPGWGTASWPPPSSIPGTLELYSIVHQNKDNMYKICLSKVYKKDGSIKISMFGRTEIKG